jgi:sulfatase maturation enzyme AslB (radical SAM superfamily)
MTSTLSIPVNLKTDLESIGIFPADLVIYVNSKCNLRCIHCYVGNDLLKSANNFSIDSLLNFINSFPQLDRITLLGGEPLLYPDIEKVFLQLEKIKIKEKRITTNLTVLNNDLIDSILKSKTMVCVSLDGHNPSLHDLIRGKGSFNKTINNLKSLIKTGVDIEITHTINSFNKQYLWELIDFLKNLGIHRLNLHKTSPKGNALNNKNLIIKPSEWREIVNKLRLLNKNNTDFRIRYEVGYVNKKEFDFLVKNKNYHVHADKSFYSNSGHRVVLYPDGNIYISSEAFNTDSYIATIKNGYFEFNNKVNNEMKISKNSDFSLNSFVEDMKGDDNYPIALSVSFRETIFI